MKIIIEPAVDHRGRGLGFSRVYVQANDGEFQQDVGTFNDGEGAEIEIEVSVQGSDTTKVELEIN